MFNHFGCNGNGLTKCIYIICYCLTTLETRRLRGGDQIEVFKMLNGLENIDPNIFFS